MINMFFPSLHKGILTTTVAWLFHFHIQSTAHLLCFFLFILFRSSFVFIFCLLSMALCLTFFFQLLLYIFPQLLLPLFPLFISAARSCFPCFPPPNSIPHQFSPHLSCFFIAKEASVKATCKRLNRQ